LGPALENLMLHDVVVHLHDEQPLLVDLLFEPRQTDSVVICRNLRTINGKKPAFVDRTDSTFLIPVGHVRFVEIHEKSIAALRAEKATRAAAGLSDWERGLTNAGAANPAENVHPEGLDSDLLRRIHDA
jgi:hypothetical protein